MIRYLLTFILTLCISFASAETKSIGVVMSGGGAKGLYHIGVLEALEQSGVPIDYVAGTSMGAIIAGLYASGYSPAEMREIAESGALERWASGYIDANYSALFRRGSTLRNDDATLTMRVNPIKNSEEKITSKKRIPKSLISTTQIDMAISELFTPAAVVADGDFSQLMVPFLCVASDVANDKKVVMTEGDLAESIRASMAIPIAFNPIMREGGEILYDGGIQDNFPWQPMQEIFSPDVIIGAVCGEESWSNTDDLSLLDQAFLLAMNKTNFELPENGVMIERDVPIGMLDFSNSTKAIDFGYSDTKFKIQDLVTQLGEDQLLDSEFYERRRAAFRAKAPELIFDSYDITGLNKHQEEYVKRYISTSARQQRSGAKREREMDFEHLQRSLYSVLATGDYTTKFPIIKYDSLSSRYSFSMGLEYKPSLELSMGGNLSSTPFNQIYLSAKHRTIERVARTIFGELYLCPVYNTGRLGYRVDFYHNAPIFIDAYYNFAVKNLDHGNFGNITDVDNTMSIKSSDNLLSVGIGSPLKQRSQIILRANGGVEAFKYDDYNYLVSRDSLQYSFNESRFRYAAGKVEIERSTIDNIYLPNEGSLLSISAIGVYGKETSYADSYTPTTEQLTSLPTGLTQEFSQERGWLGMRVSYIKYFNLAPKKSFNIGIDIDGVYTTMPTMYSSIGQQFMMPSYQPVKHSQMVYMPEYSAPRYVGAGAIVSTRLWRELYLRLESYAFARDYLNEETSTIVKNKSLDFEYINQASLVYTTPVGPISLSAIKYGVESWNNLYLTFDFGYTIFAPKGTFY